MIRLVGVAVLLGIGALALGCAAAVVVGRAARRAVRPEPRCPVCGELTREHYAQVAARRLERMPRGTESQPSLFEASR